LAITASRPNLLEIVDSGGLEVPPDEAHLVVAQQAELPELLVGKAASDA
jgi:hypothetical protein